MMKGSDGRCRQTKEVSGMMKGSDGKPDSLPKARGLGQAPSLLLVVNDNK